MLDNSKPAKNPKAIRLHNFKKDKARGVGEIRNFMSSSDLLHDKYAYISLFVNYDF